MGSHQEANRCLRWRAFVSPPERPLPCLEWSLLRCWVISRPIERFRSPFAGCELGWLRLPRMLTVKRMRESGLMWMDRNRRPQLCKAIGPSETTHPSEHRCRRKDCSTLLQSMWKPKAVRHQKFLVYMASGFHPVSFSEVPVHVAQNVSRNCASVKILAMTSKNDGYHPCRICFYHRRPSARLR
jgi:hypothetical protein